MDSEYKRNAFKDIDLSKPIELDFTGCKYLGEIHLILKKAFGFPDYYGENWSALWDCLNYLFYGEGQIIVRIIGFTSLEKKLQEYCMTMLEIFDRVHASTPNVIFQFIS